MKGELISNEITELIAEKAHANARKHVGVFKVCNHTERNVNRRAIEEPLGGRTLFQPYIA